MDAGTVILTVLCCGAFGFGLDCANKYAAQKLKLANASAHLEELRAWITRLSTDLQKQKNEEDLARSQMVRRMEELNNRVQEILLRR